MRTRSVRALSSMRYKSSCGPTHPPLILTTQTEWHAELGYLDLQRLHYANGNGVTQRRALAELRRTFRGGRDAWSQAHVAGAGDNDPLRWKRLVSGEGWEQADILGGLGVASCRVVEEGQGHSCRRVPEDAREDGSAAGWRLVQRLLALQLPPHGKFCCSCSWHEAAPAGTRTLVKEQRFEPEDELGVRLLHADYHKS
eukprot:746234-Hanusia_phi.AAC.1